jgi:hypothetical protein
MQISTLLDTNCMQKYSFKHVHKIRCLSISTYTSLKAHNSLVQTKYCITYKRKWQTCCNLHCNFLNSYNIHFRKNLMFSPAQKLSNVSHHKGYNATFKVPSEETLFHNYPPPSRFGETGWELSCAPVFKFDSAVSFHLHVQCKQISCPFSLYYPKDTSKDPPLAVQYRSHKLISI